MRNFCIWCVICLTFLPISGTILAANTPKSAQTTDSLLTEKHIRSIYLSMPDSALHLLNEAEASHRMQPFRIDILRCMVYESLGMYALKERYLRRVLTTDSVQTVPARKLKMLTQLAAVLERQNKYEEGIRICSEAIGLAQAQEQKAMESELLFTIGRIYGGMQRRDEALQYMYRSIDLLKGSDNVRELAYLSTYYGDLSSYLNDSHRNGEAIKICRQRLDVIHRMSGMSGPPPGYIDQQYGYLYSKLAWYYQQEGETRKAAEACRNYLATAFSSSQVGQVEIVPYLLHNHQYHEALQRLDNYAAIFQGADTISYNYTTLLSYYAQAYRGLGNQEPANSYLQRIIHVNDHIYQREKASQAHEFAILYQTQEKDMQIRETQAELKRQYILFAASSLVALLLVILLWEKHLNLRRTRERNRIAVCQIDELLAQKEELRKAYAEIEKEEAEEKQAAVQEVKDEENRLRFMQMEASLISGKLFLNPNMTREDLMKIAGLSKNRLSALLQEQANDNLSGYLNRLRVEYSVALLKEKDKFTIDAIATLSGFNSRSAYYTAFNKVFHLSPAQYRDSL
ncbi:AraC family transcriptional regulator [Bacteroides cutis]|uniref:AraC family transcriptional regulator n=1 Tax=Bacteroides cutis TaxID=2024197 RepID=UPI000C78A45F|nr:AraC family transcriptional regulator [Bacteroides cutis]